MDIYIGIFVFLVLIKMILFNILNHFISCLITINMSAKERKEEIIELALKYNFIAKNGEIPPWSSSLYKDISDELNK